MKFPIQGLRCRNTIFSWAEVLTRGPVMGEADGEVILETRGSISSRLADARWRTIVHLSQSRRTLCRSVSVLIQLPQELFKRASTRAAPRNWSRMETASRAFLAPPRRKIPDFWQRRSPVRVLVIGHGAVVGVDPGAGDNPRSHTSASQTYPPHLARSRIRRQQRWLRRLPASLSTLRPAPVVIAVPAAFAFSGSPRLLAANCAVFSARRRSRARRTSQKLFDHFNPKAVLSNRPQRHGIRFTPGSAMSKAHARSLSPRSRRNASPPPHKTG